MVTGNRKGKMNLKVIAGGAKSKLEDEVDALFKLPLAEFIGARQALAARVKKEGRGAEADLVKALVKPSISAWVVNQLYWRHREPFERLIAAGERFRDVQKTGKVGDMREALDTRRDVLSHLSDLAAALLSDADHNPTLDMTRRIATTLEAISAYPVLPDGLVPGRFTKDIDPPGFDSLAAFLPSAGAAKRPESAARALVPPKVSPANKPGSAVKAEQKSKATRLEQLRQEKLAAAKASLQAAKNSLAEARARAKNLEAAQKKADAEAKQAENHKREAEERFRQATSASDNATRRARNLTAELAQATRSMEYAARTVETASNELESLFRAK